MKHLTNDRFLTAFQVVGLIFLLSYTGYTANKASQLKLLADTSRAKETAAELKNKMTILWLKQATWSRTVLLCEIDQLPGTAEAERRLTQNQIEIGNLFKPYYGIEAGRKLSLLLNQMVHFTGEICAATKKNDTLKIQLLNEKWQNLSIEITAFFSARNPAWADINMNQYFVNQINYTNQQAKYRTKKEYASDIESFDQTTDQMMKIAEILSTGIVNQFPAMFLIDKPAIANN